MMETIYHPLLGETVCRGRTQSGLTVLVNPRPGFRKQSAYLVVGFGSIHRRFAAEGKTCELPAGTAHYLEHKMFDLPDRDLNEEFAALGANPNAFTSYDMTAYHFTSTGHFIQCLKLLLELVSTPYFTEQTVEKERGIITQEILMYEDQPDSKVFDDLLCGLFRSHPIRENIAGTEQSIAGITADLLHEAYRAFYRPENMVLCVCADADPEEVLALAEQAFPPEDRPVPRVEQPREPDLQAAQAMTRRQMDVAMPTFQLGWRCEAGRKGEEFARWELAGELAVEILMGEASRLYLELYEKGLIDSSFGAGLETLEGCAMVTCGGDSDDPEAVRDAIQAHVRRICREGIDPRELERLKRSTYGSRVKALDSFEATCFRLAAYRFEDWDYLEFPRLFDSVTAGEVLAFLEETFRPERAALSIVEPL